MNRKWVAMLLTAALTASLGMAAFATEYESIDITAGNAAQEDDSLDTAMDYLVNTLNERTGGAVTGTVHNNSQLGGHSDMISAVQMGSIQVAEATAAILSTVAPKFTIFDLPYIAPPTAYDVYDLLSGEAGKILIQDAVDNAQIHPISWMCRTPRHVYSAVGPIETIDDWKGLKIRTMQSAAMVKAMELLGAQPQEIATAERYLALQTGVVDAAENNVAEIYNCKEYEVTSYLSKTAHLVAPNVMYVGENWLNGLSEDLRALVLEVGTEAGELATKIESENEESFEEKLVSEGGMTVNVPEATDAYAEKLAPLYEEYADVVGEDLLAIFQEANAE